MRPNTTGQVVCPTWSIDDIRTATTGVFGFSGYQLPPKERCKTTINLISGDDDCDGDEAETVALMEKQRCPLSDSHEFLFDR